MAYVVISHRQKQFKIQYLTSMGFMCRRFSRMGCFTWFMIGHRGEGVTIPQRPVTLFSHGSVA